MKSVIDTLLIVGVSFFMVPYTLVYVAFEWYKLRNFLKK